jgi:hypothetical protein
MATAADGVTHPSHEHHQQADDEEDDPDDQADVGEGESRDEAREEQSEDDEDDAENDHDDYLVSVLMFGRTIARSVPEGALQPERRLGDREFAGARIPS